jgi:assimilatory nitrate reductase catalytic subunit
LVLNTGRTRDQWHTMTRTGKAPRLAAHQAEPWLAVHPADAARFHLRDGGLATVESAHGAVILRVSFDPSQRPGEVFAPMHWNDQFASSATVGRLIAANTDPVSGQPELKFTPIRVSPLPVAWQAVLLSRTAMSDWERDLHWSRAAGQAHVIYRLAGEQAVENWPVWVRDRFGQGDWLEYQDRRLGHYRAARVTDGRLDAVFFAASSEGPGNLDWLAELFERGDLSAEDRTDLLAGGTVNHKDVGSIVCSCHRVGRNTILDAIDTRRLASVDAIGRALRAGTNCGSCIPELRRLLAESNRTMAVA